MPNIIKTPIDFGLVFAYTSGNISKIVRANRNAPLKANKSLKDSFFLGFATTTKRKLISTPRIGNI